MSSIRTRPPYPKNIGRHDQVRQSKQTNPLYLCSIYPYFCSIFRYPEFCHNHNLLLFLCPGDDQMCYSWPKTPPRWSYLGMVMGRVWVRSTENTTHEKNIVRLNLTPKPALTSEIWYPNPSGAVNGHFLSGFDFFFRFQVHQRVKNETYTQT
jgi:hypothetical protein